jgi:ABC-type uncharacterized transport system fused permease/ATPase subunit
VSIDVEGHLYSYMKSVGITLITVSHRETLWKYHEFLLKFHGDREYYFIEMPEDRKLKPVKVDNKQQEEILSK